MESLASHHIAIRYKRRIIVAWWLALAATTVASLNPYMGPPSTPWLGIGLDKFIHLGVYMVLVTIPVLFFSRGKAVNQSVLMVAVLSVGIEGAQDLVPERLFSLGDMVANMTGVTLGAVIGLYFRRHWPERFP